MDEDWAVYKLGAFITWFLIFVPAYIYCIYEYGFLFGLGLGWLPSAIVATVLCWFWPFYALVILGFILYVTFNVVVTRS